MTESLASPRRAGAPEPDDAPPVIRWRVIGALFVVATLIRFAYFYLDDLTRGIGGTFAQRALEEGTGNIASALLFPVALFAERYYPVTDGRWRRNWIVHVAGYVVYSALHTTLIAVLRDTLSPAIGLGAYDYGRMSFRYFMEASQDFFSYAMFLGVLTLIRVQQRLRARELRAAALERDAARAQLEALSLRLQPHFLFNALNTISSVVYEDAAAADELIGRLGELLRESLRVGDEPEITVREELAVLEAYVALVQARFGDRLRVAIDVDADAASLAVPAFLLQPLVENAVKHGTMSEADMTTIDVRVVRRGPRLELVVENDAEGDAEMASGIGLRTTRERLRLLCGDEQSIDVVRAGGRFRVVVQLPARPITPRRAIGDDARAPLVAAATADARSHR